MRGGGDLEMEKRVIITLCLGSACYSRGALDVLNALRNHISENKIEAEVSIVGSLCEDNCRKGPVVEIAGVKHFGISARKAIDLLDHVLHGRPNA